MQGTSSPLTWNSIHHIIRPSNRIGHGAVGVVYKGRTQANQEVAVKRVFSNAEKELHILKRVRHPNLLTLVGFCRHEGSTYIVTNLAASNLQERLLGIDGRHVDSPLTQKQRLTILLGTARALKYLHSLTPPILHM